MKIKTSELLGAALDYAVALCEFTEWSTADAIANVTVYHLSLIHI